MKKYILLIILFKIFLINSLFSAGNYFGYMPPTDITDFQYFELYTAQDIDTIYNFFEKVDSINSNTSKIDSILKYSISPYFVLSFNNMDDTQIMEVIRDLERNSLTYNILGLQFIDCPIKHVSKEFKMCSNLYMLSFEKCDSITSFKDYNTSAQIFSIIFDNCAIKELPSDIENLKPYIRLGLAFPEDFEDFNLDKELTKFKRRNNLFDIAVFYKRCKQFPKTIFNLKALQTIAFYSEDILYYPPRFNELPNLINLFISCEGQFENLNDNVNKYVRFPVDTTDFLWQGDGFPEGFFRTVIWQQNRVFYKDSVLYPWYGKIISLPALFFIKENRHEEIYTFNDFEMVIKRGEKDEIFLIFNGLNSEDKFKLIIFKNYKDEENPFIELDIKKNGRYKLDLQIVESCVIRINTLKNLIYLPLFLKIPKEQE